MKKLCILLLTAACVIAAGCTTTQTLPTGSVPNPSPATTSGQTTPIVSGQNVGGIVDDNYITEEEAKAAAFNHAGVSATDSAFTRVQFNYDDGRAIYDVEFFVNQTEYDYEVDATNGDILAFDFDIDNYTGNLQDLPAPASSSASTDAVTTAVPNAAAQNQSTASAPSTPTQNNTNTSPVTTPAPATSSASVAAAAVPNSTVQSNTGSYITVEAAKAAALNHAGLPASSVTFIKAYLDRDDGRMVYDVEFYSGNAEYDYEINATTGAVVSFDYDVENFAVPRNNTTASTTPRTNTTTTTIPRTNAASGTSTGSYITAEAAKSAALNHAGLSASSVTFIKAYLDRDDGRIVYDVEFWSGNAEYDYEISATTGAVVSFDYDVENFAIPRTNTATTTIPRTNTTTVNPTPGNTAAGSYISAEAAKAAALQRAGLSASNVSYIWVEFEYDDGRPEYQVNFVAGTMEYDVEVSATTGNIIGYDIDSIYD